MVPIGATSARTGGFHQVTTPSEATTNRGTTASADDVRGREASVRYALHPPIPEERLSP